MKLSERQRQRLYAAIDDAVMQARVRIRMERATGDALDRIVSAITENAFRTFVDEAKWQA